MTASQGNELKLLDKAANDFARKELAPGREENDKYPFGLFFDGALEKAFALDFFHAILPEELGGMGQGMEAFSVILRNICQEDSSLGGILFTNALAQEMLIAAGENALLGRIASAKNVRDFLIAFPVFSHPAETLLTLTARKAGNEYALTGSVDYLVLGGIARQGLVPARLEGEKDVAFFLIDLNGQGLTKSEPVLSLGLHACPAIDLKLENVKGQLIGPAGEGAACYEKAAARMHVASAAMSLGVMRGAFREALDYTKKREQGGRKIVNWSEVRMMLADMAMKIDNAEMIVERAAQAVDRKENRWESRSVAASLLVQAMACDATTDGIQLLGGVGYMKDFGQEKRFRDAKHMQALLGIYPLRKLRYFTHAYSVES